MTTKGWQEQSHLEEINKETQKRSDELSLENQKYPLNQEQSKGNHILDTKKMVKEAVSEDWEKEFIEDWNNGVFDNDLHNVTQDKIIPRIKSLLQRERARTQQLEDYILNENERPE